MLAQWIEIEITPDPNGGLGVVVDGSNNAIQDITPGGAAAKAGVLAGDLIARIDGVAVTEFDGMAGPAKNTVLITSEPQSIMGAHAALDTNRSDHTITLLRHVDPAPIPAVDRLELPSAPSPLSADESLLEQPEQFQLPDARQWSSGGDASGEVKTKYNLPAGMMLTAKQQVEPSLASLKRKEMLLASRR